VQQTGTQAAGGLMQANLKAARTWPACVAVAVSAVLLAAGCGSSQPKATTTEFPGAAAPTGSWAYPNRLPAHAAHVGQLPHRGHRQRDPGPGRRAANLRHGQPRQRPAGRLHHPL